jgi:hypothetical protein
MGIEGWLYVRFYLATPLSSLIPPQGRNHHTIQQFGPYVVSSRHSDQLQSRRMNQTTPALIFI